MEELDYVTDHLLGDAHARSDRKVTVATARKPWATPQVILGEIEDTENNPGFGPDGAPLTPPGFNAS